MYILLKRVDDVFTVLSTQKSEFDEDSPELQRFLKMQEKENFTSTIFEVYCAPEEEEVLFSSDTKAICQLLNTNMRAFYTHYGEE